MPAELRAQAAAACPQTCGRRPGWGTPALDLRGRMPAPVLRSAGVATSSTVGGCTIEDESCYSYRRAAVTGRFAGVVT